MHRQTQTHKHTHAATYTWSSSLRSQQSNGRETAYAKTESNGEASLHRHIDLLPSTSSSCSQSDRENYGSWHHLTNSSSCVQVLNINGQAEGHIPLDTPPSQRISVCHACGAPYSRLSAPSCCVSCHWVDK